MSCLTHLAYAYQHHPVQLICNEALQNASRRAGALASASPAAAHTEQKGRELCCCRRAPNMKDPEPLPVGATSQSNGAGYADTPNECDLDGAGCGARTCAKIAYRLSRYAQKESNRESSRRPPICFISEVLAELRKHSPPLKGGPVQFRREEHDAKTKATFW